MFACVSLISCPNCTNFVSKVRTKRKKSMRTKRGFIVQVYNSQSGSFVRILFFITLKLQMATSNMKRLLIILYVSTFSLMTPLGIGIGIALTSVSVEGSGTRTVEVAVLHGLAAGTLVYVVFFEILEKERSKKSNGLLQVSYQIFPIQ